jgi:F-box domain
VLSIFLSPYQLQLRESIAAPWDTGSHYVGRKKRPHRYIKSNKDSRRPIGTLHAFITTLAYPWIWASAAQSRSSPGDTNYSLQVDALLFHTSINMEERLSSPESIQKKRKRSPYASDSESQTMVGDSTSEANNGLASGHTSPAEQRASSLDIGPKRTRLDGLSPASDLTIAQPAARAKVPSKLSELPPELLQHIFTFLPPLFLGRLLRVSRVINTLLDPNKVLPQVHRGPQGCLSLLDQDHVWSVSRKRFIPGLPRPLSSVSELELWRLLLGSSCQFCGKRTTLDPPSAVSPWNSGPGTESVRIIWPFAVRSCGSCLSARLVKVMGSQYLP